jgi:hypothetical protein
MIKARSVSTGFVHDRLIEVEVVALTRSPVTGPGGVLSGATSVVPAVMTALEVLPLVSLVNTA